MRQPEEGLEDRVRELLILINSDFQLEPSAEAEFKADTAAAPRLRAFSLVRSSLLAWGCAGLLLPGS